MSVRLFVRIRPERNERRWYAVACCPTLFGTWGVLLSWGRLGTNWQRQRILEFSSADEARAQAEAQAARRLRRGYRLVASTPCRNRWQSRPEPFQECR